MQDDLGPVMLRCRNRTWIDRESDLGYNKATIFLFVPIFGSFVIASFILIACLLINVGLGLPQAFLDTQTFWIITAIAYTIILSLVYLFIVKNKNNPGYLMTIHRDGIHHKRDAIRFDELRAIRFGRESQGYEAVLLRMFQMLGKFSPHYRQFAQQLQRANEESLSLILKDGRICAIRGARIICNPDDFQQAIQILTNLPNSRLRRRGS